ncbi:MAG TPA: hypothetical protein VI385_00230 [Flavisolibacter sp.]
MKTALVFLAGAILLLVLVLWNDVHFTNDTVDLHFYDTYFIVANSQVVLVIISFPGTLSSLGGVVGTRFRNKFFLIALMVFLLADAYILWTVYPILKNL